MDGCPREHMLNRQSGKCDISGQVTHEWTAIAIRLYSGKAAEIILEPDGEFRVGVLG